MNAFVKTLQITACIAALAGCAASDNAPQSVVTPASWTNAATPTSDAVIQQRWWENFNDPALNDLIRTATEQNLDVKIAATRVRAARAQLLSTEAGFLPNVNGGASVARSRGSGDTIYGPLLKQTANLYDAQVDASWEFNIFSIGPAIEAANATIKAAEENQNGAIVSLLGEVARDYIELRHLQQSLALTDNSITAYQTSLDLANARQNAGLVSGLDPSRAAAILASQQAERPVIAAQINANLRAMEVLLGQNPGTLNMQLSAPADVPMANSPLLLATPAAVIANRPDVRAAEQTLRAANAGRRVASAEYFPSISLPGAFGWQAERPQDMFSNNSMLWSLTGGINVPIFDFGRIRADINLADANAQTAFFQYQKSVQAALSDVETALSDYLSAVNRAPQLDQAVVANQTTVQLSQERYKEGLVSYLDVTTAQQSLYAAQEAVLQNKADMASRLVTLYKVMGGGWQNNGEINFMPVQPVAPVPPVQQPMPMAPVSPSVPVPTAVAPPAPPNIVAEPVPTAPGKSNAPRVQTETKHNNPVTVIE